jgi:ribosome maturation factor RimP
MKQMKGTRTFPSSFIMSQDLTTIQALEKMIGLIIAGDEDIFLVSVRIKPINNIKVFLDADSGLAIDKCVKINRAMYKVIEENEWYPDGNFSLEVSSPGIDEPLKLIRQYKKNINRNVELTLNDESKLEGKLLGADEEKVVIEQTSGKNKKAVTLTKEVPFADIKQTKVLIAF